jgi:hypothetical protein
MNTNSKDREMAMKQQKNATKEARQFFESGRRWIKGQRYDTICVQMRQKSVITARADQQDGIESWVGPAGSKKRCSLRFCMSSQLRSGIADENSVFLLLLFRWCYRSLIILYR